MAVERTISKQLAESEDTELFRRVAEIIEAAQTTVARTVNTAMVHACWLVGQEIVVEEQKGPRGPCTASSLPRPWPAV